MTLILWQYIYCHETMSSPETPLSPRTALGRLLQERRETLGYSRTRAGAILGIPAGTIEGWELGRVAKPPLQDVLRLARFLGVSADEIELAVLEEGTGKAAAAPARQAGPAHLLEQAIALFGWNESQAAAALQTTETKVRAWRSGTVAMTLPEVMTVAALIGLHAAGVPRPSRT
jgi:transcriptional regulator with XRE-family HTH domain